MQLQNLKKYQAKKDGTTIYQHNKELFHILNQFKHILNIDEKMYKSLKKTILYHDIGKATDSFVHMLQSSQIMTPVVRHEILSALPKDLTRQERLSILTHHKNIQTLINRIEGMDEKNFKQEAEEMCRKLGIQETVTLDDLKDLLDDDDFLKEKENAIHKGILNLCDHIASAGIKKLSRDFHARNTFHFSQYTSIQEKCMNMTEDVLIMGPTGTGKTEAAFYFSDAVQNKEKSRRIFYILPYTASINAMYKRLKNQNVSVGMLHGKAPFFLYKELNEDIHQTKSSYSLFRKFVQQVTVCTLYQVVKAFFNCEFSEMMIASFSNSIFIIDEVHCYDMKELCLLLETLKYLKKNFHIHICIMSASIPSVYADFIQKELHIRDDHILYPTMEEYQQLRRHRVHLVEKSIESDIPTIINAVLSGKKTLVCVNSVKKAQRLGKMLKNLAQAHHIHMKIIHGKFNTRDREEIEKQIVKRKADLNPGETEVTLLIGTQAIEVSLDIDYDILFTEIAPIDALLQRCGRVNRKRLGQILDIKDIYVYYEPEKEFNEDILVYDKDIINKTWKVLKDVSVIEEENVQFLMNQVYTSFDASKYKNSARVYQLNLKHYKVGYWNNNFANEMIDNMGIMVLPEILLDEYRKYIDEKNYITANSLLVSISNKQFNRLDGQGKITKNHDLKTYVINVPYDSVYGLKL